MTAPLALLLLEANEAEAQGLTEMLVASDPYGWHVTHAPRLKDALGQLCQSRFDVALLNLSLPDSHGLETIARMQAAADDLPLVVLSDVNDQQLALQAVAQGAQDYLVKGQISSEILTRVIYYAIERGQILHQLQAQVIERQRSEQTLRLIIEGTVATTGETFFQALVRSLAEALNVRYAFVSGCVDTPPTRVCTYAFWMDDAFGENVEYDLYGTPCEQVFQSQEYQYYPQNIQALFPEEEALIDLQAESYAGIPLFSSVGQMIGHLAVLDDKLLGNEERNAAILKIFAARAAAEIERQQVEEALRVSQEKFSKAFRASPSAITLSTLADGQYIEVNEGCLQILGYTPAEMIGSSALELEIWPNPSDRDLLKQQVLEKGRVSNLEAQLRKKSGELISCLISAEVINLEETLCLLTVTTDITPLRAATKVQERLAEIGELASMIVHEIRNPLATLLMALSSFQRLELPERFQTYLNLAQDEGDRLKRLLNQILLYAKPQQLNQTALELNHFLESMVESLSSLPVASGKQLKLYVIDSPAIALVDADKLKQVVINLVINAFEATEGGSSIFVELTKPKANLACIRVHNWGSPIPENILPKLTKPFVTTKSSGTGLGLAIVKRILEAHGGELTIESSPDLGTRVSAHLPIISS
jgi:PAS domain S-box-containing protein